MKASVVRRFADMIGKKNGTGPTADPVHASEEVMMFNLTKTKPAEQDTIDIPTPPMKHGEFRKKLRWHIGEGKHAEFWTVGPAEAEVMLERNVDEDYRNRPVTESTVQRYRRAMADGRWVETGEPIIFSADGVLLNGQHRLKACVAAGVSFMTLIVFGIDRDAFKFMDRGLKRTSAHVFAIEGIPNAAMMASAIYWLYRISDHNGWHASAKDKPENEQLLDLYYRHEDIQESAWVGQKIGAEGQYLISNSMMVALHYLFAQRNREVADDFMEKVITGVGIRSQKDPEQILRKWLLKDNMETGGRTHDTYRAAYVVLAWNARRLSKPISIFRWRTEKNPNAPFPVIR